MTSVMKRILLTILSLVVASVAANGQKVGYMNTQTILAQIPEYVTATQTLEKLSDQYKQYLESEKSKIDQAYIKYQAERGNLNESARQNRENEIISMERALQERQKEYFGEDGVMSQKSSQLLNPIKSKVNAAIRKVAQNGGYTLILDISAMQGVAYYDESADLSLEIIRNL